MANGACAAGSRKRKGTEAALAGLETIPVAQLRAAEGGAALGGRPEGRWRNKEKVLMLTSRGIPPRCLDQAEFLQSLRAQPADYRQLPSLLSCTVLLWCGTHENRLDGCRRLL